MKKITLNPTVSFLAMIAFLIVAFAVKDLNNSSLFASCSLIIGGFTFRQLTNKKQK